MNNRFLPATLSALLGLGGAINIAFAGTMGDMASSPIPITQNGFYIAGDLGPADFMNKESHSVNPESHQLGSVGIVGGGFIGYDLGVTNKLRFAIEGFMDATGLNTSLSHAPNTYQMNQRYNVGVRVLPEYVFTPYTSGHWIFGYANGRFHINDNGVYGLINTEYNRSGFQTGAGFTTVLRDNLLLRMDGLYNIYSSNISQGIGLATSGQASQFYTNKFSQLAGEFSLIYKFG